MQIGATSIHDPASFQLREREVPERERFAFNRGQILDTSLCQRLRYPGILFDEVSQSGQFSVGLGCLNVRPFFPLLGVGASLCRRVPRSSARWEAGPHLPGEKSDPALRFSPVHAAIRW